MHSGDPAQTFELTPDRAQADGSWRTAGTLRLTFSRPVRNPRLHLSGLAAVATGTSGTTGTAARLTLTGGSPVAPTLAGRTDWSGWTVDGNTLAPAGRDGASDGTPGSAAEGSLELVGTFSTAVFRVEQRSTAQAGSTTAPPVLRQAYTVTVDEGVGTAPQGYGNASHVVSDLFLGADAAEPSRRTRPGSGEAVDDEPMVRLDHGASLLSPFAGPLPPKLQPGRSEYHGADPSIGFPTEAAIGRYYRLTVPVEVGDQPATLAGWIDFGHAGRFEPAERVQAEVPPGADTATLEWTVPPGAASGETWARLRIGRDTRQLVSSGGFADSGQVSDQRIKLAVGAARPEIAEPVDGTVLADARPEIRGEGAVPGATVDIREGETSLCRAKVGRGGGWSCRPAAPLAVGPHGLTPVETTTGGVVLRGEPVRVTVKTAPPTAPALALPAYTNDPGLQLTGTGDAGSTVSVTDRPAGGELCSTAVRTDGQWACLPVENLADGKHQLTPVAVDAAGNRTAGQSAVLVVDTVPPARPTLGAPAPGETLRVSRPRLAGRAEPGANVLVTAGAGSGSGAGSGAGPDQRTVLCGATSALDGSWTCTANRDLTDGEQWLTVTATDPAGNGASADPVRVRVTAAAVPSPATPSPSVPSPAAPSAATASPSVSASASASASVSATSGPALPSPTATASTTVVAPVASTTAAAASPSPAVAAPTEVPAPVPPGLLPIVVPTAPPAVPAAAASPVSSGSSVVPSASAVPSAPATTAAATPSPATPSPTATARPTPSPSPTLTPTPSPPPTPSPSPTPSAAGGSARAAVLAASGRPSPSGQAGAVAGSGEYGEAVARPLPVPPTEGPHGVVGRSEQAGRHGGLAGILLVLAGIGLITRRVFARGPGVRRR
ncbi:Ig-like domain-containing protein [Kitasatospora sp. NPDC096140]|uniref:Ig-like domain-containing protein n=1 Tax=Kitasatospora sp. NPDC096140 TaxID=3155425 RepID=UPI003325DA87